LVRSVVPDEAQVQAMLASPEQRSRVLQQLATQKALMKYAQAEGLDKDPKVKVGVEGAVAQVYAQAFIERSLAKMEPTEAQLKALYDDYAAKNKDPKNPQGFPTFEQAKGQLPALWKRDQAQRVQQQLMTDLKQKFPAVYAPEYRPVETPAQ
jgi:hypothetical protein